jgi:hypothetical protein
MLPGPAALAVPIGPAAAPRRCPRLRQRPWRRRKQNPSRPPRSSPSADINLTSGNLLRRCCHVWPISSNRRREHPRGTFRPQWAARILLAQVRRRADASSVFFNGVACRTHATGLLGRPASHGCVRLSPSAAATFYSLVHKHGFRSTRIVVHGSPRFRSEVASRRYREDDRRRMVYRTMPGYAGYGYPPPAYGYGYAAPRRVYVRQRPGYMPVY